MFGRLRQFFSARNNQTETVSKIEQPQTVSKIEQPELTDTRFHVEEYGNLKLRMVNDQTVFDTLTDLEIKNMMSSWNARLELFDGDTHILSELMDCINTLSKLPTQQAGMLGPISKIQFKSNMLESNTVEDITNPEGLNNLTIVKTIQNEDSAKIEIYCKDKLVLKFNSYSYYDELKEVISVEHILPGNWLKTFIPYLEHDFHKAITCAEIANQTKNKQDAIDKYRDLLNKHPNGSIDFGLLNLNLIALDENTELDTNYDSIIVMQDEWRSKLQSYLSENENITDSLWSFSNDMFFDGNDVTNPQMELILSTNIKAFKYNSQEEYHLSQDDAVCENKLSDSTLIVKLTGYQYDMLNPRELLVYNDGECVLNVTLDGNELLVYTLKPGTWIDTVFPLITNTIPEFNNVVNNKKLTGEAVDTKTLASSIFEI